LSLDINFYETGLGNVTTFSPKKTYTLVLKCSNDNERYILFMRLVT